MKKEIENSIRILETGGLLLYPTDTVWGIGCDATNPKAVKKLYQLKKRAEHKAMVCLVTDLEMVRGYVREVPEHIEEILGREERPTTVIYNHPIKLAPNLLAQDDTVAIRICQCKFCQKLIHSFGYPIVSTSANLSGDPTPVTFDQINEEIKKGVDYIVNLPLENLHVKPSKIIKLEEDGEIKVIRA